MRRYWVILLLVCLILASGLGILEAGPTLRVPMLQMPANRLGAAILFLCAGALGILGMLSGHSALRRLTRELRQIAHARGATRTLARFAAHHPDLATLVDAVNGITDSATSAVAAADLRVKELDLQLRVISAEREHLEAIIHSISDAVLVTDPFDEVVLANDSAKRMMHAECIPQNGTDPSDTQRWSFPPELAKLIADMRRSDSRGGRRIVELKVPGHGSSHAAAEKVYKVTLSCVPQKIGGPPSAAGDGFEAAGAPENWPLATNSGVVAVLHDMTREREVAQMKSDFVSNVSHELRTPLASIKAYAEMLIDGEAADEKTAKEFYEVIHNEANRLGRLIDNILNISRIESGIVKVNKQPQSLMVVLKEAIEVIAPQAKQKQISIEEQISPAFYQALIDRDMLYETCLNLLSNAVKYTPDGGKVTVQTLVDESRKLVTVRISDTGVGIPPKDLPFIFDKFYRSEANSRMAKGTGLGLSLVKNIIETVHHGRIFVESHVGKGSTFGFELPLVE